MPRRIDDTAATAATIRTVSHAMSANERRVMLTNGAFMIVNPVEGEARGLCDGSSPPDFESCKPNATTARLRTVGFPRLPIESGDERPWTAPQRCDPGEIRP